MGRIIPNTNEIQMFFHCNLCMEELPIGTNLRSWARFEIGFTQIGLQCWCTRHDCNVVHVDYEDMKHPANNTRRVPSRFH